MKRNIAAILAIATLAAGSALAHTTLSVTIPANGATLAEAPENLQLSFSEAVRLTALSIQQDGAEKQNLGPLPGESVKKFTVALPATVEDGEYLVSWRALAADTHVMNGEFSFAVGADSSQEAPADTAAVPPGEPHDEKGGAH